MAEEKLSAYANALYSALKRVRLLKDSEFGNAGDNDPLWLLLDCKEMPDREKQKAVLIKLAREKAGNDIESDILLMSFGLLNGYRNEKNIGARRRHCLEHSSYFEYECYDDYAAYTKSKNETERDKLMKTAYERLRKKENQIMSKLACAIEWIHDKPAYVNEIQAYFTEKSGRAIIPAPRSSLKIKELEKQSDASATESAKHGFINPPYIRNRCFTGREDMIAQIHANFYSADKPCSFQTLSGLGGAGKTQIALEYAYSCSEYDIAVWLDAESKESILTSIYKFVSYLGLGADKKELQSVFLHWFQSHEDWLLVYDNVDDYNVIEPFLPKREGMGHIIITSRLSKPYKHGGIVGVGVLDESAAIEFLTRRTGIEADESSALIVNQLGCLPLALEQAGAYIAENQDTSYAKYLKMLDEYDLELLEEHDGVIDYEKPLTATWNISLEKIKMESAMQLLCLCSYFAPNNIFVDGFCFAAAYDLLPEPLQSDIRNDLRRKKIVRELTRYSLCSAFVEKPVGEQLSMHHLVQQYIRKCLGDNTYYLSRCCYIIDSIYKIHEIAKKDLFVSLHHIFYLIHGGYLTHVETIDRHAGCLLGVDNAALARLANLQFKLGSYFASPNKTGLTPTVHDLFERSIHLVKEIYGPRHMNLTYLYRNYGTFKEMVGETAEALRYTELAESIEREHACEPDL